MCLSAWVGKSKRAGLRPPSGEVVVCVVTIFVPSVLDEGLCHFALVALVGQVGLGLSLPDDATVDDEHLEA